MLHPDDREFTEGEITLRYVANGNMPPNFALFVWMAPFGISRPPPKPTHDPQGTQPV